MKVGLSFSRCVRDIIEGKVEFKDVLVIIARTRFNPNLDEDWDEIWEGYTLGLWSRPEWEGYENREADFRSVSAALYNGGKLHQPRLFGCEVHRSSEVWLDVVENKE